jgi:hypothetical protein
VLVETYWNIGKGYSKSNLFNMRLFYIQFPIFQAVPGKLSWTHLVEIVRIDNELERNFYLAEAINGNWSSRQLIKQKERGLFMQLCTATITISLFQNINSICLIWKNCEK